MKKRDRIIKLTTDLIDPNAIGLVLADFNYWAPHQDELDEWLKEYGGKRTGSVVDLPSEEVYIIFKLRWL